MKPYPKYKDSGIEWIGEIPDHWELNKLKFISQVQNGSTPKSDIIEYWDGDIVWLTPDDLGKLPNKLIDSSSRKITVVGLNSCGTTITPSNSIVLSTRAPIGHLGITSVSSCTNQGCKTIVPNQSLVEPVYLFYTLFSSKEELQSLGQGSTFMELPTPKLKDYRIPYLPTMEQASITSYLDRKTQQIDTLIDKKQKMIELLKEYRTAVINHAVTKGLNPRVKMKDSGIEWLGEIPEHWEVKPLKHTVRINSSSLPETTESDFNIKYIDIGNVEQGRIINPPQELIFSEAPSRARRIVKQGDTIISTVRTYLKAIAFIDSQEDNLIASTGFAVLSDSPFLFPKYVFYLISNQKIVDTICAMSVGVSYPAITATDLSTISVWYPDKIEQASIIDYLDLKTGQIDNQIEIERQSIERHKEYRTALISNAVTGKIDVRGRIVP